MMSRVRYGVNFSFKECEILISRCVSRWNCLDCVKLDNVCVGVGVCR